MVIVPALDVILETLDLNLMVPTPVAKAHDHQSVRNNVGRYALVQHVEAIEGNALQPLARAIELTSSREGPTRAAIVLMTSSRNLL